MATVLITGARGFIGQHLSRRLFQRWPSCDWHWPWRLVESDYSLTGLSDWFSGLLSPYLLLQIQEKYQPEYIFHLAGGSSVASAVADPLADFRRTVESTAHLLDWLRSYPPIRLVAISSAAVYGAGFNGPIPESALSSPFSPYGFHKSMMESLCRSYIQTYGLDCRIVRLFSVYGQDLRKQLLWDICTRLAAGESPLLLGGSGNELRDWTSIDDVVESLVSIAFHPESQLFKTPVNVGTGVGSSVRAVAKYVMDVWADCSSDLFRPQLSFTGQSRPGDPFSLVADTSLLQRMGCSCNSDFSSPMRQYVHWFLKNFLRRMVRIAFTIIGGRAWAGGYNYLTNLLTVLAKFSSGKVQPVLFLGTDLDQELLQPLLVIDGVEVIYSHYFNDSRHAGLCLHL